MDDLAFFCRHAHRSSYGILFLACSRTNRPDCPHCLRLESHGVDFTLSEFYHMHFFSRIPMIMDDPDCRGDFKSLSKYLYEPPKEYSVLPNPETGNIPRVCPYPECKFEFTSAVDELNHYHLCGHKGIIPPEMAATLFPCGACGMRFSSRYFVSKHRKASGCRLVNELESDDEDNGDLNILDHETNAREKDSSVNLIASGAFENDLVRSNPIAVSQIAPDKVNGEIDSAVALGRDSVDISSEDEEGEESESLSDHSVSNSDRDSNDTSEVAGNVGLAESHLFSQALATMNELKSQLESLRATISSESNVKLARKNLLFIFESSLAITNTNRRKEFNKDVKHKKDTDSLLEYLDSLIDNFWEIFDHEYRHHLESHNKTY
jgi:hypothetical protein